MNKVELKPIFFATQKKLRQWFEKNHSKKTELLIGYYKKATGKPSIDWSQSVDEALCFGWIDGIRKSIDEESYCIRFTPRKPNSHWSKLNINKVTELKAKGLMKTEGLIAFEKKDLHHAGKASYETHEIKLDKSYEEIIKKNKTAWKYFSKKLAPSYRMQSIHWIMSAKREETRLRRLKILIESSESEKKIPVLNIGRKNKS